MILVVGTLIWVLKKIAIFFSPPSATRIKLKRLERSSSNSWHSKCWPICLERDLCQIIFGYGRSKSQLLTQEPTIPLKKQYIYYTNFLLAALFFCAQWDNLPQLLSLSTFLFIFYGTLSWEIKLLEVLITSLFPCCPPKQKPQKKLNQTQPTSKLQSFYLLNKQHK